MSRLNKALAVAFFIALGSRAGAQPRLDSVTSLHGNGAALVISMAVDNQGNIYLTGTTTSFDLATPGALQPRRASSSIYALGGGSGAISPVMLPSGANVVSLTADPRQNGTVYLATRRGPFQSTDSGNTWSGMAGGLPTDQVPYAFAIAPSQPDVLYTVFESSLAFRSSDAGITWSAIAMPVLTRNLAVDPGDPAHILISGWQTNDGGTSWMPAPVVDNITFDPADRRRVYGTVFDFSYSPRLLLQRDEARLRITLDQMVERLLEGVRDLPL